MLYHQFADFVFQIKKTNTVTDYGSEIDYRKKILNEYKKEKYYPAFLLWYFWKYKIRLYLGKIKHAIKKLFKTKGDKK